MIAIQADDAHEDVEEQPESTAEAQRDVVLAAKG
jgi:hypothetical protein